MPGVITTSKLGAAVIGLRMGRVHAEAWATNSRTKLVAVVDRNEAVAKEVAAAFGVPKVLTDYRPLLEDEEIDVVSVATPDSFHAEQTIQLLRAGTHVLCEKPMAPTLAECARMARTAQRGSSLLMIGQSYRFNPQFAAVKQAVDGGAVGTPFLVESEYWNNLMGVGGVGNWRMDPKIRHPFVGGCHAMDLIRWVGGEIVEVSAAANHMAFPEQPTDDCIFANVRFADGCLGRVLVSSGCQRPFQTTLDVHGDKGTIVDGRVIAGKDGKWVPLALPDLPPPIKGEINAFVESILDGKPVPVDAKDGYGTMVACFAVVESSAKGKPVKVGRM